MILGGLGTELVKWSFFGGKSPEELGTKMVLWGVWADLELFIHDHVTERDEKWSRKTRNEIVRRNEQNLLGIVEDVSMVEDMPMQFHGEAKKFAFRSICKRTTTTLRDRRGLISVSRGIEIILGRP